MDMMRCEPHAHQLVEQFCLHNNLSYIQIFNVTQLLDNTCKSTIFANIRTPAEDEKSSDNQAKSGFLLKSIELQLRYSLLL
jgi:hypothetical protein